jgi:hypothetical protein
VRALEDVEARLSFEFVPRFSQHLAARGVHIGDVKIPIHSHDRGGYLLEDLLFQIDTFQGIHTTSFRRHIPFPPLHISLFAIIAHSRISETSAGWRVGKVKFRLQSGGRDTRPAVVQNGKIAIRLKHEARSDGGVHSGQVNPQDQPLSLDPSWSTQMRIKNARAILPERVVQGGAVSFRNGKITSVGPDFQEADLPQEESVDAEGCLLAPRRSSGVNG